MTKYKVTLTAEEHAGLEQLVAVGKAAARKLTHARILLLADTAGEERTDQDIADALGTSLPTRPDKVKIRGDVEQELIRVACSDPPQGRCRWTLCLLADELVALGLVTTVSRETVRQALKKTRSGPGSSTPGASRRRPAPSSSGGWRT